jgi:xanthine dehydrogenase small subunit
LIRFLLGHQEQSIASYDPNSSILGYLREHLHRTGTKECCATGDCGACTVVLGEIDPTEGTGKKLRYRSINACVTNLGALQGRQLITVEDLKHDGSLHAVQQVLVDHHGSQCGFCTPGIVMSLFAHYKSHQDNNRTTLAESLGGNLCRCTGYRSIFDAARELYPRGRNDQFTASEDSTAGRLIALDREFETVELNEGEKRYLAPRSLHALCELITQYPGATLVAGGTDLLPELNVSLTYPEITISTASVSELLRIEDLGTIIRIGASVNLSDCSPVLAREYPELKALINRFGSRQIRNQATLGGHIANGSPVGDLLPFLVIVGAELVLSSKSGSRKIAVQEFLLGDKQTALRREEVIESVLIPKAKPAYQLRVYKISKRLHDDVSISCAAFYTQIEEGVVRALRIVFGGLDNVPRRASACERALHNEAWCQDNVERAMRALAEDFRPISDFRASAEYRMHVSRNLLQRMFLESQHPTSQTRVTHHG